MPAAKPVFKKETFRFFRELGRNNRKEWMEENRDRYQSCIMQPLRNLLSELATPVLKMNGGFDTSGRTGPNFSRINRDIRFAKDKTLYKTQMYLKFSVPVPGNRENGQFYVGLSKDAVTVGFRIYSGGTRRDSILALVAQPRVFANPEWLAQQKKRLAKKYESYWYTTEKGEWTKHDGWPTEPENWKRILAWIVRRKMSTAAAMRAEFPKDIAKIFKDLYPLLKFTSLQD